MNILHIIPGDLWAGAEVQVYYTLKELHRISRYELSVILFCDGVLYEKLLALGVNVTLLDENALGSFEILKGIRRKIIEYDAHIVHVHEYKSHILTALAKITTRKNKCILFRTIHGQTVPQSLKSHLVLGFEKFFLRYFTDCFIAVSGELKNILSRKTTIANVYLIYNAIDLGLLPAHTEVQHVRDSYDLAVQIFWIGTAARLERIKNLQMIIRGAGYLRDRYPEINFRISIFGDGSLRDELKFQISQQGLSERVYLEGHNDNILPVLQSLDIFTLTSLNEGLPMSLLEAMAVGTIPVCTAVGGIKEVISHGEDGYQVASDDAEGLADIWAYIYKERNNLEHIHENARVKIRKTFSIEQNCQKLLSLYEMALQDGSNNL